MPSLKGLAASIVVGDEALAEIVDEADQGQAGRSPTAIRYVQVSAGDEFGIRIRVEENCRLGRADGLRYLVSLDGIHGGNWLLLKNDELQNLPYEETADDMTVEKAGQCFFQKFEFSALNTGRQSPSMTASSTTNDK